MSENLRKILKLEVELEDYLKDGIDTTNVECEEVVLKISKLLDKIDNTELLEVLNPEYALHEVIDVSAYFKKYKLDKEKLKKENSYLEEFKKLTFFIENLREKAICEEEYLYICFKVDVDSAAAYLLRNMSNEDIMQLANESDDWNYKLFLFENLKDKNN